MLYNFLILSSIISGFLFHVPNFCMLRYLVDFTVSINFGVDVENSMILSNEHVSDFRKYAAIAFAISKFTGTCCCVIFRILFALACADKSVIHIADFASLNSARIVFG